MKFFILSLIAGVILSTPVLQANTLVYTYSHQPCDSWTFNGTCNFHSFTKETPEARSLQRVIDSLDRRMQKLEQKILDLDEENQELKRRLNIDL